MVTKRVNGLTRRRLAIALVLVALCGGSANAHGRTPPSSTPSGGCGALGWVQGTHMGGNFGTNITSAAELPDSHFRYLESLGATWAGIHIEVDVDDSMDSNPRPRYSGVQTTTFRDDVLIGLIRAFHAHGIKVFLSYGINDTDSYVARHPARGWQLGDPTAPEYDAAIQPQFWPWALNHPQHEQFVATFFKNYRRWAVYYAKIAAREGVELFGLGGENTGLFRTRTGDTWPNEYRAQLQGLVDAVRKVYSGPLTYEMHGERLRQQVASHPIELWSDLGLDVVGMTAHFQLMTDPLDSVPRLAELKRAWKRIFQDVLRPVRQQLPDKPILFIGGYGISDSVQGPFDPDSEEGDDEVFTDTDGDGLDDGQETQQRFHEALYRVMKHNAGIVQGGLLWGEMMASDEEWANSFAITRGFHVRSKLAQRSVSRWYRKWIKHPPRIDCQHP